MSSRPTDAAGKAYAIDDPDALTMRLRPAHFTDATAGRLAITARPGTRRLGWIVADLLSTLGFSDEVTGAGRPGEADPDHLTVWLRIRDIRDIYIQFAWDLPLSVLEECLELFARTGCTLWLAGDTPMTDHHRHLLDAHHVTHLSPQELLDRWQDLLTPTPIEADADALPVHQDTAHRASTDSTPAAVDMHSAPAKARIGDGWTFGLPADDFTTFRHSCRVLLSDDQFAAVDQRLQHDVSVAFDGLVSQMQALPVTTSRVHNVHGVSPLDQVVATWLGRRWEQAEGLAQFVVSVRAAQVATFRSGFHLGVDLDQLIATTAWMPVRAIHDPATWARLRVYADPLRPAICALAAAGIGFETMTALSVDSYDALSGTVTSPATGHKTPAALSVPEPARVYVAAQQDLRRLADAANDAHLLTTRDGPVRARSLSTMVKSVRRETGAAVAASRADQVLVEPGRFSRRLGITVRVLR